MVRLGVEPTAHDMRATQPWLLRAAEGYERTQGLQTQTKLEIEKSNFPNPIISRSARVVVPHQVSTATRYADNWLNQLTCLC